MTKFQMATNNQTPITKHQIITKHQYLNHQTVPPKWCLGIGYSVIGYYLVIGIWCLVIISAGCRKTPPAAPISPTVPPPSATMPASMPATGSVAPPPVAADVTSPPVPLPAAALPEMPTGPSTQHRQQWNIVARELSDLQWARDAVNPHVIDIAEGELSIPNAARALYGLPTEGWTETEPLRKVIDIVTAELERRRLQAVDTAAAATHRVHLSTAANQLSAPVRAALPTLRAVAGDVREWYRQHYFPNAAAVIEQMLSRATASELQLLQQYIVPNCGSIDSATACALLPTFPEAPTIDASLPAAQIVRERVTQAIAAVQAGEGWNADGSVSLVVGATPLFVAGVLDTAATDQLKGALSGVTVPPTATIRAIRVWLAAGEANAGVEPLLGYRHASEGDETYFVMTNHCAVLLPLLQEIAGAALVDDQQPLVDAAGLQATVLLRLLRETTGTTVASPGIEIVRRHYVTTVVDDLRRLYWYSASHRIGQEAAAALAKAIATGAVEIRNGRLAIQPAKVVDPVTATALTATATTGSPPHPAIAKILARLADARLPRRLAAYYDIGDVSPSETN